MKISIYFSDNTNKEIEIPSNGQRLSEHVDSLISLFEINTISYIEFTDRYVYSSDNKLSSLMDRLDNYLKQSSIKSSIKIISPFIFEINVIGKIIDTFSFIGFLGILNNFELLEKFLVTDISVIDHLLRGTQFRDDWNNSLLIRFLSRSNGNLSFSSVIEFLQRDIPRSKLKEFLPIEFKNVYGINIENAKTNPNILDKLSLKAINKSTLHSLDVLFESAEDNENHEDEVDMLEDEEHETSA